MFGPEFEELIINLKKLPGVGKKQADKIAFYLLNLDYESLQQLQTSITQVNQKLNKCQKCNFITKNNICDVCLDVNRAKKILILESSSDMMKFEKNKLFNGRYFIFDSLTLSSDKNKEKAINHLIDQLPFYNEVIISLSPTLEGMVFSNLLIKKLENYKIKVSKIAYGVPIGASIDYMDEMTLKESIENRKEIKN